MSISKNIIDREFDKFVEDENGNTAVRVVNAVTDPDGDELQIDVEGQASTKDFTTHQVLLNILDELKIMNMHLQFITNEKIL